MGPDSGHREPLKGLRLREGWHGPVSLGKILGCPEVRCMGKGELLDGPGPGDQCGLAGSIASYNHQDFLKDGTWELIGGSPGFGLAGEQMSNLFHGIRAQEGEQDREEGESDVQSEGKTPRASHSGDGTGRDCAQISQEAEGRQTDSTQRRRPDAWSLGSTINLLNCKNLILVTISRGAKTSALLCR